MWTLLFGLMLLGLAFGDTAWKLMGWAPHDGEDTRAASLRAWIKLFAALGGFLLLFMGFPALPGGVSNPGWVCFGIVLLVLGGWEGTWRQEMFLAACRESMDASIGYGIFRIMVFIGGAIALGIGVGTGYSGWNDQWEAQKNEIQIEQMRAEHAAGVRLPTD